MALEGFDALSAILPLSRPADDVEATWAKLFGSAFVLLLLSSVLPPLLRRLSKPIANAKTAPGGV